MASEIQAEGPIRMKKDGALKMQAVAKGHQPALLVVFREGEEDVVHTIADVIGQPLFLAASGWREGDGVDGRVIGILNKNFMSDIEGRNYSRTVINIHCVTGGNAPDENLTAQCSYEYLYTRKPSFRRDVARFLSFVLGQINPHRDLLKKARTTLISTTFPEVHAALPNLDILSVGADAVELRVDLLKEPLPDGSFSSVPSLKYVGEQVMLLRQRTELPIIFTTRCTNENGRFPMDNPENSYTYLHRAIQWGCEYIDVELWLPEAIRRSLAERKGYSTIISAFHDFSGTFKWTSPEAQDLYRSGAVYGDVVKMIALVTTMQENYELEYFRSTIQANYTHPPLSGLNMGPMGQLSRALNKVFTPITHPLLPMIAAPGQMSAAEINSALHSMGQMPKLDVYVIGNVRSASQAMFYEKCFNELSLPHQLISVERPPRGSIEAFLRMPSFGGAYINPPLAASAAYLPSVSDAAREIGQVDTVVVRSVGGQPTFVGENATWKGIRATLSRDFVPSAYSGRAALVLAGAEADATAAIFALRSLGIGPVYTIGFRAHGPLAAGMEPFRDLEDIKRLEQPFVVICALPAEKSQLMGPLLKLYSKKAKGDGSMAGKVFVDLANGPRKGDPLAYATSLGWTAYSIADVSAWTTVETLRLLVGQNVPYDFSLLRATSQESTRVLQFLQKALSQGRKQLNPEASPHSSQARNVDQDAVPKKRGPKTDVLEALLKRVDGLEKRLKSGNKASPPGTGASLRTVEESNDNTGRGVVPKEKPDTDKQSSDTSAVTPLTEPVFNEHLPNPLSNVLLETYFIRVHGVPYHILDEAATRQRLEHKQLPIHLLYAIYAVSVWYAAHLASYAAGRGKKSYMLLTSAISMAVALELYREFPSTFQVTYEEREGRRKLFWTCYLMDRFAACGSTRPSVIADESILLRLPSWQPRSSSTLTPGEFFPNGSNLPYVAGAGKQGQNSAGMLISIVRILGITNRYLAAGGVKGDRHFPWHSLSNLSKIRQDLDTWAAGTQDTFASLETLFGQPDSTTPVLSKLIYHLVHCLVYRPFLPVDLGELSGTGQHQSWQIEATNLCFLHANAIAELVEIGKASSIIDWPAFVGYCICTAGTIHVHGAHYPGRDGEVYSSSAEFLSREMQQLTEVRFVCAGVQHQRDLLQTVYGCHSTLVESLASNPIRFSPVFHLEDFFNRYPGQYIEAAHVSFTDVTIEAIYERYTPSERLHVVIAKLTLHSLSNYGEEGNKPYNMTPTKDFPGLPQQSTLPSQQKSRLWSNEQYRALGITNPPPVIKAGSANTPVNPTPTGPQETPTQLPLPESSPHNDADFPARTPTAFSPHFSSAPLPPSLSFNTSDTGQYDPMFGFSAWGALYDHQTPGAASTSGSAHTDPDKDPFLTLLEQLTQNERSSDGPSELDSFLKG
ncbi:hypothetical protein B0A49_06583 [Cryomyces minteri]|uniref:Xylanolytic transcriptional activator regulatory domain-containing protein n=1 Tax=Cryomyces minteri TaxID=331657 RepID=A0A4U0X0A1_9PEZI|nr:hypothetical protein B0A49_06583 [Cryomyces minteri]